MIETLNLVIVVLLVLANGFFVASEFALVGVRKSRIETLAKTGDVRARRLLPLLNNLNAYISATQLGITLASLALGWIGEPAIAHLLEAPLKGRISETLLHTLAFTIAFSIITFLHIVLGELRSEERRVGKEWRSRRSPSHEKKKKRYGRSRRTPTEDAS